MVDNLWIFCILTSPTPPPPLLPPHLFAQDKSSRANQNGGRRFTLDWLVWRRPFNRFIGLSHFLVLSRIRLFSNAGYAAKLHTWKCLAISIFVVQFLARENAHSLLIFSAYFSIRPKKNFCFSEKLSIQKATFDFFFEQLLSNVWKISSNLWKALCETGSGRSSNYIMELCWRH